MPAGVERDIQDAQPFTSSDGGEFGPQAKSGSGGSQSGNSGGNSGSGNSACRSGGKIKVFDSIVESTK
ncbi:MAG: hypothetical protein A2868_00620 [Candidatus Levybacteria bacterium RIFCSPHIGHO2_01_FULL_40_15b]|nr:MAG: hypothetical protein A2868_00620 [Candidatus Levybacteria bacterium RIFCSPHIGHO2_01_FULL_40_15b]